MRRLGEFFTKLTQRFLPDPLALACLLTLLVFAISLCWPHAQSVSEKSIGARTVLLGGMWLDAIWNKGFLTFALQMCLVLLTGFGLAKAPLSQRVLKRIASIPRTNRGAVMLIAAVSCVGCWINWGFGLILAGVLASELRSQFERRNSTCQYALIVAAAYAGMMIWHGGLSGSAPLKVASEGLTANIGTGDDLVAAEIAPITIDRTLLGSRNLLLTAGMFVAIPIFFGLLAQPSGKGNPDESTVARSKLGEAEPTHDNVADSPRTFASFINESPALPWLIGGLIFLGLFQQVSEAHSIDTEAGWFNAIARSVNLNFVNSLCLAMGLVLHGNLMSYLRAVASGGTAIVGIVIQFPLYSGIQGLMSGAGLAAAISNEFVEASQIAAEMFGVSVESTFPLATLASAGVVNFFVPSGGGQWIVQGPVMCGAAHELGYSIERTVMAIAYGDQLTNMVQPFWAIPLMGMTKVNAREFMGYCALLMLVAIPIFGLAVVL
ncbi:MAG: short-chain fatty acids transporter [Phycisphaerae bacterium]|nr:MAG: short-chain fatty acids transporter [Phycisphaerae bacterium]